MATLKTEPRRAAQAAAGRLSRLIYASTAREPLDGRGLARLVRHARAANRAAGVTGVLVYDAGGSCRCSRGRRRRSRRSPHASLPTPGMSIST
ncbi:MAG: BLUF domain-containing protein [Rhodobacteraceae bacterium]|nr:BLUF domain-containing protein [Paracoccaceae bacterium]